MLHRVTIEIRKSSYGDPFTDEEVKEWVEEHFYGCDYGSVKVTEIVTENPEVRKEG